VREHGRWTPYPAMLSLKRFGESWKKSSYSPAANRDAEGNPE
jgi:hypothetical protein